jgi:hypothetical protein
MLLSDKIDVVRTVLRLIAARSVITRFLDGIR